MHSVQKVFVQKPAGVAGRSLGSAGPEDSAPVSANAIISSLPRKPAYTSSGLAD